MAFGTWDARPTNQADVGGDIAAKLYVASLPYDIEEEEIRKVFGVYGVVAEVHINRPTEGRPDRSAFVRFEEAYSASSAMLVLSEMHKFRPESMEAIKIMPARGGGKGDRKGASSCGGGWSGGDNVSPPPALPQVPAAPSSAALPPPPAPAPPLPPAVGGGSPRAGADRGGRDAPGKLWVGNLPADINADMMQRVFGAYGEIVELNILPPKARSGMRCAFVNFATVQQADACLAVMGMGYELRPNEEPIKVERPGDRFGGSKGGYGGYSGGYGSYGAPKGGKGYFKPY